MIHVLFMDRTELDADDRACLEDVYGAAKQAGDIIKQSSSAVAVAIQRRPHL